MGRMPTMAAEHRCVLQVIDAHYGGDVSRVVVGGVPVVPGTSVASKRDWLATSGDALRRMLLGSPYGDPSMCANVIVDPDPSLSDAEAGYVIMEAMGYPHFSGSNSMCVVAAWLESGELDLGPAGRRAVHLEAPSGPVTAVAEHDGRHVTGVTIDCDPAWIVERGRRLTVPSIGDVPIDLVWSGCFYAVIDAAALGFALSAHERPALADVGRAVCDAAAGVIDLVHPEHGDTGPLSFVAFAGRHGDDGTTRAATYVHPGVVCRCPTGTGTAARLALAVDDGTVAVGDGFTTVSPTESVMHGEVTAVSPVDGHRHVAVAVTGRPFTIGRLDLVVNLDDDLRAFDDPGAVDSLWRLLTGAVDR